MNSLWATHAILYSHTLNAIWLQKTHVLSHNCHFDSILSSNKSSLRRVCGLEDIRGIAGVPKDNTTTVVGDAKETPRFLRLSAVGFVPRAVRQKIDSIREVLHPASYRINQ